MTALECGLMHALHFRKGCFVGQESIGKTVSMANAVRRRLCAVTIQPSDGSLLTAAGDLIVDGDGMVSTQWDVAVCGTA